MRPFHSIKPQDIAILLKLVLLGNKRWRHIDLVKSMGLSQSEISFALDRCRSAGFLDTKKKIVMKSALLEFISHGLKYVFPVKPGPICRGMSTAHSALPLSKTIASSDDDIYVWPWDEGKIRGQAIEPLYFNAPLAAENDPKLYKLLAIIDGIRAGRAREKNIAIRELEVRFARKLGD
jgi:hypothetical protein